MLPLDSKPPPGRGTGVVHFRSSEVVRVDTLRHQPRQPEWFKTQICGE